MMKLLGKIAIGAATLGLPLAAYAGIQRVGHEDAAQEAAELANAPVPVFAEAQARQIAMAIAHGTVAKAEYENEDGAWRWSFDISESGRIHEVGVDAMTGHIVEDSWEAAGEED